MNTRLVRWGIAAATAAAAVLYACVTEQKKPEREEKTDAGERAAQDAGRNIQPTDTYIDGGTPDAETPPAPELRADVNIAPGSFLKIFASDFSAIEGEFWTMGLKPAQAPQKISTLESTDTILRTFGDKIYALDRAHNMVRVFDRSFHQSLEFSIGTNSVNPQDIVVLPERGKAYISRLDSQNDANNQDDVVVFDPNTGQKIGGFDLKTFTLEDGDRLARAAQMTLVDNRTLYVTLQDLNSDFSSNTNGEVVVIDTENDTVTGTIPLAGSNPNDITYSERLQKLFVADTGSYDPEGSEGIETIDAGSHATNGFLVSNHNLGGFVSEIRIASADLAYVLINSTTIASFHPGTGQVFSTNVYQTADRFLPDFTVDENGWLVVGERDPNKMGVLYLDPSHPQDAVRTPLAGLPPSSFVFGE